MYNLPQGIYILTGGNHFSKYRNSPLIFTLAEKLDSHHPVFLDRVVKREQEPLFK